MSEFHPVAAELTLSLEGSAVGSIANNLTTTVEGYALDARQGYMLDQKKLDISHVADNLVTATEGWALSARQGKYLQDTKVGYTELPRLMEKAIADSKTSAAVTLYASSWSGSGPYTQTVAVDGVTSDNIVLVSAAAQSYEAYVEALVRCTGQEAGKLTFSATEKPEANLTANVLVME